MLIYPIFISDDPACEVVIESLPGQKRWGVDRLEGFLRPLVERGLKGVILFGVPEVLEKVGHGAACAPGVCSYACASRLMLASPRRSRAQDDVGTHADTPQTPVILALRLLARLFPRLLLLADVCLCEYTSHGHCGVPSAVTNPDAPRVPPHLNGAPHLDPSASADRIAQVALAYAQAGAHVVAPSDMMDGRIRTIKDALIKGGYANRCAVMSYSAKFASGLYGPFRWVGRREKGRGELMRGAIDRLAQQGSSGVGVHGRGPQVLPAPTQRQGTRTASHRACLPSPLLVLPPSALAR